MNATSIEHHQYILIVLIFCIGGFAGYINALRNTSTIQLDSTDSKKSSKIRYILSGVGAAILVPLFLNMLSSNLIKYVEGYDTNNYFVFAGFCFIAGYFSDKFIDSIGDKLLKELQQTKEQVNSTNVKLEQTTKDIKANNEKVDALIDNDAELNDNEINSNINLNDLKLASTLKDDEIPDKVRSIVNSFHGSYKFRTVNGIAKALMYPSVVVEMILAGLEEHGAVKKFIRNDKDTLWSLTKVGQLMVNENLGKNESN